MRNQGSLTAIIAVSIIGFSVVIMAGLKKKPRIVESAAMAEVFAVPETAAFNGYMPQEKEPLPEITNILMDEGRLIIGTNTGIFVLPSVNGDENPVERKTAITHLNVILPFDDSRYIGADRLYKLDNNYVTTMEQIELGSQVNDIIAFGEGLLVGTDEGLWYHCDDIDYFENCPFDTLLRADMAVTALAEDRTGLWVGSYGDGLYRFDGQNWQERFLRRDTSMFQYVQALEYIYPFLWVGTEEAIFRYDGGKWAQMFVADSSEHYDVTSIMTTPAATYIGSTDGLLRFADNTLKIVSGFEGMRIAGLSRSERGVLVATCNNGIFTFNGKEQIVSPEQLTPHIYNEDEENNVLAETVFDVTIEDEIIER